MVIAIYNHKGGTGKTTTAINVGKVLKDLGYKTLLVDLDSQANLTYAMGIEKDILSEISLSPESLVITNEGLEIIPNFTSPQFLVDYEFPSSTSLRDELSGFFSSYDYVLLDCPPAMNITVVNALLASEGVIIPAIMDPLSLEALRQVLEAMNLLLEEFNHTLSFKAVLPVMVDSRRQLTKEVKEYIHGNFNIDVFENTVRMNVKIAESPSYGESVISYSPDSNGTKDYNAATNELLTKI